MKWTLALLLPFCGCAYSGSRFWEATVPMHQPTNSTLQRRAYYMKEKWTNRLGMNYEEPKRWPNGHIPYCFSGPLEEAKSEDKMTAHGLIGKAMNLWYSEGLSEDFWFYPADDASCVKARDRNQPTYYYGIMMVSISETPAFWSSVGASWPDPRRPDKSGPQMTISLRAPHRGLQYVVAAVAHEIGHAFGLLHEHQRWTNEDYSQYDPDVPKHGVVRFFCYNLADYAEYAASAAKRTSSSGSGKVYTMEELCTNDDAAYDVDFSASNFLPTEKKSGYWGHDGTHDLDLDYNSIMIYESETYAENQFSNVIEKFYPPSPDPTIKSNNKPSQRDIAAMRHMYPEVGSEDQKGLHFDDIPAHPDHEHYGSLKEVFCNN